MDQPTSIQKIVAAKRMLAEAKTLDDIVKIRDIAEAARVYARAAQLGLESQNEAAEIKIRAERKAGELLLQMPKQRGARPPDTGLQDETPQTYNDLGIEKVQAHRWQAIASLPEATFEEHITETKAEGKELTSVGVYREARRGEMLDRLHEIELHATQEPDGLYDVIVIDPPWPMVKIERDVAPNQVEFEYPTMTIDEIKQMQLPMADDCHLWLWTTHKFLPDALEILRAWGVKYICSFVWHKAGGFQPFGLPQYNCEFALYARKGAPIFADVKDFKVCFDAPRGAHSEKPEEFYDLVRRVTAGRRLDMFNRRQINGFDGWGNEAC